MSGASRPLFFRDNDHDDETLAYRGICELAPPLDTSLRYLRFVRMRSPGRDASCAISWFLETGTVRDLIDLTENIRNYRGPVGQRRPAISSGAAPKQM